MKQIGVKIIAEDAFGYVNTWHDAFENSIESIIESNKVAKDWVGGKILEVYLEFDIYGTYYKVFVDVDKQGLNNLLQS